jgi:hypothetical protein
MGLFAVYCGLIYNDVSCQLVCSNCQKPKRCLFRSFTGVGINLCGPCCVPGFRARQASTWSPLTRRSDEWRVTNRLKATGFKVNLEERLLPSNINKSTIKTTRARKEERHIPGKFQESTSDLLLGFLRINLTKTDERASCAQYLRQVTGCHRETARSATTWRVGTRFRVRHLERSWTVSTAICLRNCTGGNADGWIIQAPVPRGCYVYHHKHATPTGSRGFNWHRLKVCPRIRILWQFSCVYWVMRSRKGLG